MKKSLIGKKVEKTNPVFTRRPVSGYLSLSRYLADRYSRSSRCDLQVFLQKDIRFNIYIVRVGEREKGAKIPWLDKMGTCK